MARAASDPMLLATDLADALVKSGVPFRSAHELDLYIKVTRGPNRAVDGDVGSMIAAHGIKNDLQRLSPQVA